MKYYKYEMEITDLYIYEENGAIAMVQFEEKTLDEQNSLGSIFEETPLIRRAAKELYEYFVGKRREFTVPLLPKGTEFQKKVWQALCEIPYGETRCYSEIAQAIGNPKACRAVGAANRSNPIAIMIPCHRVITKSGELGGYGGMGPLVKVKEKLLALEKQQSK